MDILVRGLYAYNEVINIGTDDEQVAIKLAREVYHIKNPGFYGVTLSARPVTKK